MIELAMFRYGLRFEAPSYVLRVLFNGTEDDVTFPATGSLDPNTDYFFLEDGSEIDLCQLLADSLMTHAGAEIASALVTIDPTSHALVIEIVAVGAAVGLQLRFGAATNTLDATIFGFVEETDSGVEDLILESPNVPMGLVYLGRPVTDDSRPRQGVLGGSVRTLDGDVETTTLDDPYRDRSLSVMKLHRSIALDEYAPATSPFATLESMHLLALARGHRIHYIEDDTDPATYSILKLRPPLVDTLMRDDSTQSRMLWKWSGDFVEIPPPETPVEIEALELPLAFFGPAAAPTGAGTQVDSWGALANMASTGTGNIPAIAATSQAAGAPRQDMTGTVATSGWAPSSVDGAIGLVGSGAAPGVGGFDLTIRFSLFSDPGGWRALVGVKETAALFDLLSQEPTALTTLEFVAVGFASSGAASSNFRLYHSDGGGAVTDVDTGIARNTTSVFQLRLRSERGSGTIEVELTDLASGESYTTTLSTNIPGSSTPLLFTTTSRHPSNTQVGITTEGAWLF